LFLISFEIYFRNINRGTLSGNTALVSNLDEPGNLARILTIAGYHPDLGKWLTFGQSQSQLQTHCTSSVDVLLCSETLANKFWTFQTSVEIICAHSTLQTQQPGPTGGFLVTVALATASAEATSKVR